MNEDREFTIEVAGCRWRFLSAEPELLATVRQRYASALDPAAPRARAHDRKRARDFDFELAYDDALDGSHPTRFTTSRRHGDSQLTIESGALAGDFDLAAGRGRIGLLRPTRAAAHPALIGMGLENYLRHVIAVVSPRRGALLAHSAAVSTTDGQRAVLFYGKSGAGKSTSARLSLARDPRHAVLSDDLVILDHADGRARVHATPFWGDDPPATRPARPFTLAAAFQLVQASTHALEPMSATQAAASLLATCPFQGAMARDELGALLEVALEVIRNVPSYTLRFRKDAGFWDLVERNLA